MGKIIIIADARYVGACGVFLDTPFSSATWGFIAQPF
jgi:hypothetical protein